MLQTKLENARYIGKVLFGLLMLALWVVLVFWIVNAPLSNVLRFVSVSLLLALALLIPFMVHRISQRMDELQRLLHQLACTRSLPWLITVSGIVGVLQVNDLLPVFNQLWMLIPIIAIWGVQLMLADRPHH